MMKTATMIKKATTNIFSSEVFGRNDFCVAGEMAAVAAEIEGTSRPQYRHTRASGLMLSAQNGHSRRLPFCNTAKSHPIGPSKIDNMIDPPTLFFDLPMA